MEARGGRVYCPLNTRHPVSLELAVVDNNTCTALAHAGSSALGTARRIPES